MSFSMETTFHFVDARQTDRAAKRRMRSHVMKGKNAGRTIHRRSRLTLTKPRSYGLGQTKDSISMVCYYDDIPIEQRRKEVEDAVLSTAIWDGLLSPVSFRINPSAFKTIHQCKT
jgi:hypothetical protein